MRTLIRSLFLAGLILGIILPPVYFSQTESGPFIWLAEWELRTYDSYGSWFSVMALFLGWGLAFGLLSIVLMRVLFSGLAWEANNSSNELCFGVCLFGIAAGAWLWQTYAPLTAPVPLKLAALEQSSQPVPRFVTLERVSGLADKALLKRSQPWRGKFRGRINDNYYLPVVSNDWRPGQPVALFIYSDDVQATQRRLASDVPPKGLAALAGVPEFTRRQFAARGIVAAPNAALVHLDEHPSTPRNVGAIIGGACALIGLVLIPILWRQARIAAEQQRLAAEVAAAEERARV